MGQEVKEPVPPFIRSLGPVKPQVKSTLPIKLCSMQRERHTTQSIPRTDTKPVPTSEGVLRVTSAHILSVWQTILTRTGEPPYSLGLGQMDNFLWGLHKKELLIIGGRPGQGKTAMAVQLALAVAKQARVLYYSLEMSREQIIERMLSHLGRIDNQTLRQGHLDLKRHTPRIQEISCEIAKLKFFLADDRGYDIEHYSKDIEAVKADFIFCDYIQLLKKVEYAKMHESIAQVLAAFKVLSKKVDVGFVICSQLNREGELKSSGSLEEVADSIIELNWEGKEDEDVSAQGKYLAEVVKQRHGPTGKIYLWYRPDCWQFSER